MPTRIIREGILTSEPINSLSTEAELFYRRLMSVADDYGRYYSHPGLLRAACYPLRLESVSEKDVKRMLSECEAAGTLFLYHTGKYLQIAKFKQQTRAASKFPQPSNDELLIKCKAGANHLCSESESESETKSESGIAHSGGTKKFLKPKAEDVTEYAKTIQYALDGQKFCDHYEAKGWLVGRSPMRDWKAAVRTWKNNGYGHNGASKPYARQRNMDGALRINAAGDLRGNGARKDA